MNTVNAEVIEIDTIALAEWCELIAKVLAPDTEDSVQESAIAENNSRRIPGNY